MDKIKFLIFTEILGMFVTAVVHLVTVFIDKPFPLDLYFIIFIILLLVVLFVMFILDPIAEKFFN